MNTQQLRLFGLAVALAIVPMMTANVTAQQWAPGVTANIGDTPRQLPQQARSVVAVPTHTVVLNQQGGLEGTVASIDANTKSATGLSGLYVFFVRDGQVVRQTQTAASGAFSINGLAEGAYSFYAAGKNGLAAYGVYVTSNSNKQNARQNILEATAASANNYAVQQLIQRNTPPQVAQTIQAALQASQGNGIGTELQPSKQIQLIEGRLYGQVSSLFGSSQPIAGLQVQLIQNGQAVAQVQTDANGTFSVPDVDPGVYDYVIAGNSGFAAGQFEAIGQQGPMTQVSFRKTITQLDACLTCPCQSCGGGAQQFEQAQPVEYATGENAYIEPSYADTYSAPVEYAGESISYGGASGGSCGACSNYTNFGGGGIVRGRFGGGRLLGGGGGGLSRILTLGALGGGIIAIADDDSGPNSPIIGN